jgi:amino acid adenylation domain-containing protein
MNIRKEHLTMTNHSRSEIIDEETSQAFPFWRDRIESGGYGTTFPSDHAHLVRTGSRSTVSRFIPSLTWSRFSAVCDREGIDTGHAILGLLQVLLHRYTCADTIEVGLNDGRLSLVRTEMSASNTLRESVHATVTALTDAMPNACSWESLLTWSNVATTKSGRLPFSVLLSISALGNADPHRDATIQSDVLSRCDLALSLGLENGERSLLADYDPDRYDCQTVQSILRQITLLMDLLEGELTTRVEKIPLCDADEARSIVLQVNSETMHFETKYCIQQRFEEQVRQLPDSVAIAMPGAAREELSYSELNKRANRLAHYLRSKGVGPDVLVGLYLERTPALLVAMLAIVKAGGAYLPIDLSYPPERVAFMIGDAEAPLVIVDSESALRLPPTNAEVLRMGVDDTAWANESSDNPECNVTPENLLYCIFTSGSTGKPKGVLITHANVSRLFDATEHWFHFTSQDTWTFFHSSAFDFSVWEIWGALLYGGRLVIVPYVESRSAERFYEILDAEKVTVLNQTPSAFRQLIGADESKPGKKLEKLRLVIFGGEALNLQSLAPWFEKYGDHSPQLVNMYGITETTVHVTYRPLKRSDLTDAPGSVIGVAIPDLQLFVLDAGLRPVPVGVPGEVFVGGAGVAKGYLKRESLTAERFLPSPFSTSGSERLYRSGDLARRLHDGDLEYMGRADQQVKIRGFRIEIGEVQSAITRLPSVRESFVTVSDSCDGQKELVAYVIPSNGKEIANDTLRRELESALPSYMVPSKFIFLERMPLTGNGKIDRSALPAARAMRPKMETPFHSPQNEMEHGIASIYQEVLNIDKVGIDDDFFDLGGNSLKLADVHARLEKLTGRRFSAAELFLNTTVRELAKFFGSSAVQDNGRKNILDRAQRQRAAMSAGRSQRR